jgi:hypothetical protein
MCLTQAGFQTARLAGMWGTTGVVLCMHQLAVLAWSWNLKADPLDDNFKLRICVAGPRRRQPGDHSPPHHHRSIPNSQGKPPAVLPPPAQQTSRLLFHVPAVLLCAAACGSLLGRQTRVTPHRGIISATRLANMQSTTAAVPSRQVCSVGVLGVSESGRRAGSELHSSPFEQNPRKNPLLHLVAVVRGGASGSSRLPGAGAVHAQCEDAAGAVCSAAARLQLVLLRCGCRPLMPRCCGLVVPWLLAVLLICEQGRAGVC